MRVKIFSKDTTLLAAIWAGCLGIVCIFCLLLKKSIKNM